MSMIEDSVELVTLTSDAAAKVRELLAQEAGASGLALRLSVDDGSCSGHHYAFCFDRVRGDDFAVSTQGVTVVVDPASAGFVRGSKIDFVLSLEHSGFKVENPNAGKTCRCGESFEMKESGAGS